MNEKNMTLFNNGDSVKPGLKNRMLKNADSKKPQKALQEMAILVTNGSIKNYSQVWRNVRNTPGFSKDCFIAAADGGAMHCINFRIIPDLIIGDMDSITKAMVEKLNTAAFTGEIEFISCSPNKDESDTQIALDHLIKSGFKRIIILGAFGSRADHSFANLVLLSNPAYEGHDIRIITDNSEIFIAKKTFNLDSEAGKKLSLFSLTPYVFFERTTGLKYRLKKEKLLFSPVRGLSNEFTKNSAKISFSEGVLLVVREL